ncbi:MAG TPA: Tim44-like domain-containing protein [Burkholderiales bacterium]|nr:Tim44-like domain-containing protein [Burkholderiales bacterium]
MRKWLLGKWVLTAVILGLGGILAATDVEARRLGGGRNLGAQRNVTAPPAQTPAKQQQAAPAQQQPGQAAPAAARTPWAGILGGLAIGGLLGYLFGGSGMMGFLLLALLAIAAVVGVRALMRRRAEASHPVQFAGMRETVNVTPGPVGGQSLTAKNSVPAGFDASGFLRAAKLNFLRLQAANDTAQLEEIREFTTEELYEALKSNLGERQQTEVTGLEADLLELATEGEQHWASVRFSGTVREAPGATPEAFSEVWNLVKPADGSSGWLLAGIQQMH